MRPRGLMAVSVGLNAALLAALYLAYRNAPPPLAPLQPEAEAASGPSVGKTNVVVRRQFFTWAELESTDFKAYIANLRSIACPEPTIRDIIVAEVNALYEQRRATEVITPEQQWWRADPDPSVAAAAASRLDEIDRERRALLTELLGPNWDTSKVAELAAFNLFLDGPVLGKLPVSTKEAVRRIEAEAVQRRQAYLANVQAQGLEADARELARLRRETRTELARVLTSGQMEEYLLRYSASAQELREQTRGLGLSAEEFRNIFRARDGIDEEVARHYAAEDSASRAAREAMEARREGAVKEALGPERYELYRRVQDPVFRRAQELAEEVGAPAETVLPLYQIRQATAQERRRIRGDKALTPEERAAGLARVAAEQEEAVRRVLGDEAFERYLFNRDASGPPEQTE